MNKHILYLAAGSGSRFGSNKLLCPLEGKPLFRHGLDTLAALVQGRKDCDLTVVSRYGPVLESARAAGARAVDSPDSAQGLSFTIRAGLSALSPIPPEDFLLFVAADQPRLGSGTAARLLDAACPGVLIAAACWESQPGNPVLFSAALLGLLTRLFPLDAPVSSYLAEQTETLAALDLHQALTISSVSAWCVWLLFLLLAARGMKKSSGKSHVHGV